MTQWLSVEKPCPMQWRNLQGDGLVRHCWMCEADVFDLTDKSAEEVKDFIEHSTGRPCVRILSYPDGHYKTEPCADVIPMVMGRLKPIDLEQSERKDVPVEEAVRSILKDGLFGARELIGHLQRFCDFSQSEAERVVNAAQEALGTEGTESAGQ